MKIENVSNSTQQTLFAWRLASTGRRSYQIYQPHTVSKMDSIACEEKTMKKYEENHHQQKFNEHLKAWDVLDCHCSLSTVFPSLRLEKYQQLSDPTRASYVSVVKELCGMDTWEIRPSSHLSNSHFHLFMWYLPIACKHLVSLLCEGDSE